MRHEHWPRNWDARIGYPLPAGSGRLTVEKLLVESDVLLLPSYAEGMAMALIEGMSWGLPVVTTSAGGAGEFLEQGHNCILVTPGDIQGISDAISELARDRTSRQRWDARRARR